MLTPVDFMQQYRTLRVPWVEESAALRACRPVVYQAELRTCFLMKWAAGSGELAEYQAVTRGPAQKTADANGVALRQWFLANQQRIQTAGMGKGAPGDYQLALEWAVRSGHLANPSSQTLQAYCDGYMGIDCSGFATNYLAASGKRTYSSTLVRNTSAQSYYNVTDAVNDVAQVKQGDLLVWMKGNLPLAHPGHVAVVQAMVPLSSASGNLRVVEATGAAGAKPKLLDSWYLIEKVIPPDDKALKNDVMVLQVKRHGVSGSRVAVMRPK